MTMIQDTFGYHVSEKRMQRGWSEARLAEEVNKLPQIAVSTQDVKAWEASRAVL